MAFDNRRPDRVGAAIREEVARFLADGVKDPRVRGLVTVTGVDVTRDLRHARVFVSIMGDDAARNETFEGLAAVASHLRGHIGRTLRLRAAPEIEFRNDPSVAHAARIETLLEQVQREREVQPADDGADDSADEAGQGGVRPGTPDGAPDRASDGAPAD